MDKKDLKKLKINELKEIIKKHKVGKVSGSKAELVARILQSSNLNEILRSSTKPEKKKRQFSQKQLEAQQKFKEMIQSKKKEKEMLKTPELKPMKTPEPKEEKPIPVIKNVIRKPVIKNEIKKRKTQQEIEEEKEIRETRFTEVPVEKYKLKKALEKAGLPIPKDLEETGKTEVHSLLFDKNNYTESQAEEWLKQHNYKPIKEVEITDKKLRYRITPLKELGIYRTVHFGNNIEAIIEILQDEDTEEQSLEEIEEPTTKVVAKLPTPPLTEPPKNLTSEELANYKNQILKDLGAKPVEKPLEQKHSTTREDIMKMIEEQLPKTKERKLEEKVKELSGEKKTKEEIIKNLQRENISSTLEEKVLKKQIQEPLKDMIGIINDIEIEIYLKKNTRETLETNRQCNVVESELEMFVNKTSEDKTILQDLLDSSFNLNQEYKKLLQIIKKNMYFSELREDLRQFSKLKNEIDKMLKGQ